MDDSVFKKGCKIHFIGIGGISMSALARILANDGCIVTGSDMKSSHITRALEEAGIKVHVGHDEKSITDQDLVVYTAAVKSDNPEYIAAKEKNIPLIDRAELLGTIMKGYSHAIAVSGTHGKTSTTGMISQIFLDAGTDPTITLGGELDSIGGNLRVGGKDVFIAEACEYCRSFLKFFPTMTVILNIEEDHLDYYKDIDDIIDAFRHLALLTPDDGFIIANEDSENVKKALADVNKRVVTFGFGENSDYRALNVTKTPSGHMSFDVYKKGEFFAKITLSLYGRHNVSNALAAVAAADSVGIDKSVIVSALSEFRGAHRRFERKGTANGALVIDDYAHHPSEIEATLSAASELGFGKIFCVFQPHTYTRTKTLFPEFVRVLSGFDIEVLILDIYAAREKDTGLVSSRELSEHIKNSKYMASFEDAEEYLKKNAGEGDMIITMGAGDVYKIGEKILD